MNTSIATSNPIDSPQSANNSYPTTKNANSKNGKKILIADDEQYIRELYEEVLSSEGYSVEGVADGKTALEKISEGGWDLITLDVIMPKLDGLGILTKLEETPPKKKNGPIILLTSLANDPAVLEAMQNVSENMDYKVSKSVKKMTAMLEPLLLVFVGLAVGGMMMAIIAPIYGLIGSVGAR